jgi:acetyl esterase/lipase
VALDYPTLPGDIDHLIADDHAVVERQFQHLEAGRGNRRVLVDQISFELALHAFAEETVLYPLWPEVGLTDEHEDAEREHREIKDLLVVLGRTEPGEDEFEQALANLIRTTRHHVADEETEELPDFRQRAGPERMAELGGRFLAAKRMAPTRPHPHAPDEGVAERIAGMLARPLDLVRDVLSGRARELGTDASGLLDPPAQTLVDAHASLGGAPFEILEPDEARKQPGLDEAVRRVAAERDIEFPEPVGSVEDRTIPDAAGGPMRLRVYRPAGAGDVPLPIVMWIHGGGWVLSGIDASDASCRGLCNKISALVVSPDYRRAPEAVFPAAHDDVLAAWRWTVANAGTLGGDASQTGIGGESVGGTMAAATVLQLAEVGDRPPQALVLVHPLTTGKQFGDSMEDAADARPLNRPLLSWMLMHAFQGEPDAMKSLLVELLEWDGRQLTTMPPTLVVTAERDPLRSQGWQFLGMLQAAGVPATDLYYQGVMHEFFGAAAVLAKAEQAQREAAHHFLRAFGASRPTVAATPS